MQDELPPGLHFCERTGAFFGEVRKQWQELGAKKMTFEVWVE